jgi:hypothetical protein
VPPPVLAYRILLSQYFFILFLPEKISAEQIASVEKFSLHSIDFLEFRVSEIVLGVIMGNRCIDEELEKAMLRFRSELL